VIIEDQGNKVVMNESLPMCEYLEEMYPSSRQLLPADALTKFKVRRICEIINAGMQPIANLGVLQKVASTFGDD
jgi:maleylpyruvate isomerase